MPIALSRFRFAWSLSSLGALAALAAFAAFAGTLFGLAGAVTGLAAGLLRTGVT